MRVGSLFSGIGGLDLGLERAGMTVAWQSEIDPYACKVLTKHWPTVPNLGDITTIDWSTVEPVDLICGGYPCQPFSLAGVRRGEDDPRHLWPHMLRAVRCLRPRYALLENVPGHLSLGFDRVLGDLAEIGYDTEWFCLPAAAMGAPHLRWRLFAIATDTSGPRRRQDSRSTPSDESPHARWATPHDHVAGGDGPVGDVADTDTGRRNGRPRQLGTGRRRQPADGDWWAVEPDVGRVAHGIPNRIHGGGLNAHPRCLEEARTKGIPETHRLRILRDHLGSPAASSEPPRCDLCGHPLSAMPCRSACAPWRLGSGGEEAEDLRCLREGVLQLLALAGEDVQPYLSLGTGTTQRTQAVGKRVDRLRCLGNAVVPQVAEHIGHLIMISHTNQETEKR